MEMKLEKVSSLYFVLVIFLATIVSLTFSETQNTPFQKLIFNFGMFTVVGGTIWRIVLKLNRAPQKPSVITQTVGTAIVVLNMLSTIW